MLGKQKLYRVVKLKVPIQKRRANNQLYIQEHKEKNENPSKQQYEKDCYFYLF